MQKTYNANATYWNFKYCKEPLTITVLTTGYIGTWTGSSGITDGHVLRKWNNNEWITVTTSKYGNDMYFEAGAIIKFKDAHNFYFTTPFEHNNSATFNISGNLLSWVTPNYLGYYPNTNNIYYDQTGVYVPRMFKNIGVISAENLIIPKANVWVLNSIFEGSTLQIPPRYIPYALNIQNTSGALNMGKAFYGCPLTKLPNMYTGRFFVNQNSPAINEANILSPVKTEIYCHPYIIPTMFKDSNEYGQFFSNNSITDNSTFKYDTVYYTNKG